MKLDSEFYLREEDMQQTALLALFEHRHSVRARAFAQAQYALMNYVLVSIWGITRYARQSGEQQPGELLAEDLRTDHHQDAQEMLDWLRPCRDKWRCRPVEYVKEALHHIREYIRSYLSLSPMMQQMVRLHGRLVCYHHDELTPEVLNQPRRYVVVFPHGAFTVHCKKRAGDRYAYE